MKLTVFTPTYNRAGLLKRAYESLLRQTSDDFEWLIVDDGSTDNTKEVVEEWIKEGKIRIRYHFCENGGKMRAHNIGAGLAETELFLCLDSDDYITNNAVELINTTWDSIMKRSDSDKICGIVAHKGKSEQELLSGVPFPQLETSGLYNLYLNGFRGETTLIFRTDVLKKYPFPEIEGEKYVPEDYVYDKIDRNYVLFLLDEIITVCEIVSEGYTDSVKKLKRENKIAWYMYYEQRAKITPKSLLRYKYLAYYAVYAKRTGKSIWSDHEIVFIDKVIGCVFALGLKITGRE